MLKPGWFASLVPWPSLGSRAKGRHHTQQLHTAKEATLRPAIAVIQRVCLMTCCAASTTPSLLVPQMRHVAALEALLWK